MGTKTDKQIERLKNLPSDYTYDELCALLKKFDFLQRQNGVTGGSRVKFIRERDKRIIMLHKPHPGNIVKKYILRDVLAQLKEGGDIS